MALHHDHPDLYEPCLRCDGTGQSRCTGCAGSGSTVGPSYYLRASGVGRRFGLKVCWTCNGRGTERCTACISGSVRKRT